MWWWLILAAGAVALAVLLWPAMWRGSGHWEADEDHECVFPWVKTFGRGSWVCDECGRRWRWDGVFWSPSHVRREGNGR
jgi:hypothetical protein